MLSYYLKCRKNTENKNTRVAKTNKGKLMFLSKCSVCIKKQEASGLLNNLGVKTPMSQVRLLGGYFF